jgi:hypothetical protein
MSDFQVGEIVHRRHDNPRKRGCHFFVIVEFRSKRDHYWSGNTKKFYPPKPGAVIAPVNSRTLSRVPGRKTEIEALDSLRRLNLLEVIARVS